MKSTVFLSSLTEPHETLDRLDLSDCGFCFFGRNEDGRKYGMMSAAIKHIDTNITTRQAACGIPSNNSSQTVMSKKFSELS